MLILYQMQVFRLLNLSSLMFCRLHGGTQFSELYFEGLFKLTYQYNERAHSHVSFDTTFFRLRNKYCVNNTTLHI